MAAFPPIAADGRGRSIAKVAGLALGQAVAAGVAAFATRDIFQALHVGTAAPTLPLTLLALSGLALAGLRIAERVTAERVGHDYAATLRLKLFKHVAKMPQRQVAERRAGGLALRFVGDLQAVRGWISTGLARLLSASIVIPVTTAVLFALNPMLGAAAAVPIVLGLAVMAIAGALTGPVHRRVRERRARLAADMSERLPHGPELRLLGRVKLECERLVKRTEGVIEAAVARARAVAALQAVPDVIAGAAAAALLFAAWRTGASPAEAAGSLAALGLLIHPIRTLGGVWDRRRAWLVAREKCRGLLETPTLGRVTTAAEPEGDTPPALALHEVAIGQGDPFSARIEPGEKIAIVGPNGAGKSSVLALAAGLEAARSGEVLVDGRDVRSLSMADRARSVAFAGPRSPILKGSLRRALTMGCMPAPTDDAIIAAAKRAGLESLLERLGGLDGAVREGGRNLSAGEARRVLLVRALLGDPALVLLDEPDDALDPRGNRLLAELITRQQASMLVVTHDLALARRLDRIWYVADNRVVESGPPADLLAGSGPTAQFFQLRSVA